MASTWGRECTKVPPTKSRNSRIDCHLGGDNAASLAQEWRFSEKKRVINSLLTWTSFSPSPLPHSTCTVSVLGSKDLGHHQLHGKLHLPWLGSPGNRRRSPSREGKERAQPRRTCLRPHEKPLTYFQIGEISLSALFTWERISVWRGLYVVWGEAPKI